MKFLVDANLPPSLAVWIREQGLEAVHSRECLGPNAPDLKLASLAETENYVLVTKDSDFARLSRTMQFSLVWLRIGNATNPVLENWIASRWPSICALLHADEQFVEVR